MTSPMAYNGANNADDPLVTPWNIRGWTAQNIPADSIEAVEATPSPGPPPSGFTPDPFPAFLEYVQVAAPYFDMDGNPLSGFLTFLMSDNIVVTYSGSTYRLPARYAGRDNSMMAGGQNNWGSGRIYIRRGYLSVTLFATNNSTVVTDSGNPLTLHVVEHFLGGQQFDITVPASSVSPADLRSLIVAGSIAPYNFNPASPMSNEGYVPIPQVPASLNGVTSIDGGTAQSLSGLTVIDGGSA